MKKGRLDGKKFETMNWPMESWECAANIARKGKVLLCCSGYRREHRQARIIYTHTGWRMINGKPAYLYHSGAAQTYSASPR